MFKELESIDFCIFIRHSLALFSPNSIIIIIIIIILILILILLLLLLLLIIFILFYFIFVENSRAFMTSSTEPAVCPRFAVSP